jgi:type IV pilus assembly protein PilF
MTDGRHRPAEEHGARHVGRIVPVLVGCAVTLSSVMSSACIPSRTPGSASDEQKSLAEYDLAGDAFKNRRFREALDHVQQALKLNPDNAEASYLGAAVLLSFCALDEHGSDCRLKEAEGYARKTIASAPEHRDAKNALGVILINEKRYDEAIAILKPLADDMVYASPESAWGNLGWAYLLRGSVEEAIDALRRAIAVQPFFCVGQYRLGLAFEKKGDLGAARDSLTKALETEQPQCKRLQDAYSVRARVYSRQGLREEARADLKVCRDMAPDTPVGLKCAAQLQTYP